MYPLLRFLPRWLLAKVRTHKKNIDVCTIYPSFSDVPRFTCTCVRVRVCVYVLSHMKFITCRSTYHHHGQDTEHSHPHRDPSWCLVIITPKSFLPHFPLCSFSLRWFYVCLPHYWLEFLPYQSCSSLLLVEMIVLQLKPCFLTILLKISSSCLLFCYSLFPL